MKIRGVLVVAAIIIAVLAGIVLMEIGDDFYFDGKILFLSIVFTFIHFLMVSNWMGALENAETALVLLQSLFTIYVFIIAINVGVLPDSVSSKFIIGWFLSVAITIIVNQFKR